MTITDTHTEPQLGLFPGGRPKLPGRKQLPPAADGGGAPPYAVGSDTSREAADSIEPDTPTLRDVVLRCIRCSPRGMTCDEVEVALEMRHQTASARVHELMKLGRIVDTTERRKTRSGRRAAVWRAVE